jgi:hypothetical protein
MRQIKYIPVDKIYIQNNKGYKLCGKKLEVQATNYDLAHSMRVCFGHALQHNYNRILVCEDDFMIDERITQGKHLNNIKQFIKRNDPYVYSLGGFIAAINPLYVFNTHMHFFHAFGAQGVIYNSAYMHDIVRHGFKSNHIDHNWKYYCKTYMYHKPLVYQLFYPTPNSQTWPFQPVWSLYLLKLFQLDKQPLPGFDILMTASKTVAIMLLLIALTICISVGKYFRHKK